MNNTKYNILIIDDDTYFLETIRLIFAKNFPNYNILSLCNIPSKGIKLIDKLQPDLLLLDMEMPKISGLELLTKLDAINFEIIIITSYNQYAIQAIKHNALDYLLKPLDIKELSIALHKFEKRIQVKNVIKQDSKLAIQLQDGTRILKLKDIIRCESSNNYCSFYLVNNEKILSSRTLKYYDKILSTKGFIRIHRSHLINTNHIVSYPNNTSILLSDSHIVEISRRKKIELKNIFNE